MSRNLTGNLLIAKSAIDGRVRPWVLATVFATQWASGVAEEENVIDIPASAVREAFVANNDGYSSDEVLVRDSLREPFLEDLSKRISRERDRELERSALLKLLALRKAGKLDHPATRRSASVDDDLMPIAEIASRVVMDRHRVSSDTILADPILRDELQREAAKIVADIDAYHLRKSVLSLRKRRGLRPELVLKAVVDWPRDIQSMRLSELKERLAADQVSEGPGIYMFRDRTGYLYIGEAENLSKRLRQHAKDSDRASLSDYLYRHADREITVELHVFPKQSQASQRTARRAYESELIRSRNPRLNVRP